MRILSVIRISVMKHCYVMSKISSVQFGVLCVHIQIPENPLLFLQGYAEQPVHLKQVTSYTESHGSTVLLESICGFKLETKKICPLFWFYNVVYFELNVTLMFICILVSLWSVFCVHKDFLIEMYILVFSYLKGCLIAGGCVISA